jgi:glycosyltransferase involved in cell wall biosynthesis
MSKLLFYVNTLGHGGAERVMVNLANAFSSQGFECTLVTSFPLEWEYECSEDVKRINLYDARICGGLKRNFRLIKALRRVIKSESPDTVVSFMAEPNFRMLFASIGMKCRKIVSVRNDPNKEYPNAVFKFLAKTLYRLADGVVFQTKDAQEWFPKSIRRKSCIIMNQVNDVFYKTPLADERFDIVTTGRLTTQKNHKMLIEAYSRVADQITSNLMIYGEGELRGELEAYVRELGLEDKVFLPGATKNVPEVLRNAKAFVLSSNYEGMPNSLLEAMAMGLPCVSTDCPCGGPREILSSLGSEHLVEVGNVEQMAVALKFFCSLNEEQTRDIMSATRKISARFNSEEVINNWKGYIVRNG